MYSALDYTLTLPFGFCGRNRQKQLASYKNHVSYNRYTPRNTAVVVKWQYTYVTLSYDKSYNTSYIFSNAVSLFSKSVL